MKRYRYFCEFVTFFEKLWQRRKLYMRMLDNLHYTLVIVRVGCAWVMCG